MAKKTTIDKIATDNIINAAESAAGVSVTGSNDVGAKVVLNGIKATALTPTTWKVALTTNPIKAFGQGPEVLKAVTTDKAGKISVVTQTINVDTVAPKAAEITRVESSAYGKAGADSFINAAESRSNVLLNGRNESGSVVTVNGKAVNQYSPTLWQLELTPAQIKAFGQGDETLKIIARDKAGNQTLTPYTLHIDTTAPKPVVFDKIAQDNVIDAAERKAGVTVSGSNEAGASVTLNGWKTVAVSPTHWQIALTEANFKALGTGQKTLQAVASDAAGNLTTTSQSITIGKGSSSSPTPDSAAPEPADVLEVWSSVDTGWAMDYDNIINAAESKVPLWLSGKNQAGSTVTVNGKAVTAFSPTQWVVSLSAAEIQAFGEGEEVLQIVATNAAGKQTTSTYTLTVDTQNDEVPKATAITGVWSALATGWAWDSDNFINAEELQKPFWLYGENQPGSKVTVNGKAVKTIDATTWQLQLLPADLKALGEGDAALKIVTTDAQGQKTETSYHLTVDSRSPAAPVFDPVASDGVVDAKESARGITISGSNEPGVSMDFNGWVVDTVSSTRWKIDIAPGVCGGWVRERRPSPPPPPTKPATAPRLRKA